MKKKEKSMYEQDTKCPECGLEGKYIPPRKTKGRKLIVTFECPNGHVFTKEFLSK